MMVKSRFQRFTDRGIDFKAVESGDTLDGVEGWFDSAHG